MLQKPLPLLLILPPWDSRLSPAGPRLPVRTLFALKERVAASFFPKAPLVRIPWHAPEHKKKPTRRSRVYAQCVEKRLAALAGTAGLCAGVQCSLSSRPLEGEFGGVPAAGKLALYNHGDEYGEPREGEGGVTCPPETLRDLRDLAAARLADWPGGVVLNPTSATDRFIRERQKADRFPWVNLEFSSCLWMKPDGMLLSKRVREFADRLESILTLWCRLQAW